MSGVGPIGRGAASLLAGLGLGQVGPEQGPVGPRPPVDGVQPFPSGPSFQQRYQQDSFEAPDQQRRRGPNLGGGNSQGPASGGAGGEGAQAQARANQGDPAAELAEEERRRQKRQPADVMEFPKGAAARKRPQQAQGGAQPAGQQPPAEEPQQRRQDERPQRQGAGSSKGAGQKPVLMPKPKPKKPPMRPPPKPNLAPAFKPVMVGGQVQMERRTMSERRLDMPQSPQGDDAASAKMMVQLAQKM